MEIEAQAHQQTPPSDAAIDNATAGGPITQFAELKTRGLVDGAVIDNLTERMGLSTMTEVQTATINEALKGADMYVFTFARYIPTTNRSIALHKQRQVPARPLHS